VGSSALAALRNASMSHGAGAGCAAARAASRSRVRITQSVFDSRKASARARGTLQGKLSRTPPALRTESEMRRARRVWQRTISPSRGCCSLVSNTGYFV